MSPEELENVAKNNLYYVIWMLNKTATLKAKTYSPENNAYIESFVIHARILITFLHDKPKKGDDTILAANYVNKWNKPLNEGDFLLKIKRKANKMGAHLTEAGVNITDKDWPRMEILKQINEEFSEFLKKVPDTTISKETKEKIIKVIAKAGPSTPYDILDGPREASGSGATGSTGPVKN
jgi:hypothetical protein